MARKSKAAKNQLELLPSNLNFAGERVAIVSMGEYPTFTPDDIRKLNGKKFAIDTENTGLFWYKDRPLGVGIYCPGVIEGYLPIRDPKVLEAVREELKKLEGSTAIAHNLKYDFHFMGLDPSSLKSQQWDTVMMAHALDSRPAWVDGGQSKKLGDLEYKLLRKKSKLAFSEALDKTKLGNYPDGMVAPYCINDCRVTYEIAEVMRPQVEEMGLWPLFEKDMEYAQLLWQIERDGVGLDRDICHRSIEQVEADQRYLEGELFKGLGKEINWRSVDKLSAALYEGMGIARPINPFLSEDGVDRTRFATRGRFNKSLTDSMILKEKAHHPLADIVLNVRETDKIINYYLEFLQYSDEAGVHTNFNQSGTRTRRLSSSNPNLQNLASNVRSRSTQVVHNDGITDVAQYERADAYNPRLALIAREGHKLVSIDYKQMEMRMFGIIANEPEMIGALRTGSDIHSQVATMVWDSHKGEAIHKIHREWSKTIGFGLIYAMTTGALQMRLDMTAEKANQIANDYTGRFPRIKPWLKEVMAECKRMGYVRYSSGAIWRENNDIDMYKGANAVIQGPCGDLLSIAALRCRAWLRSMGYGRIVDLVHDEIVFEIPIEKLLEAIPALSTIMQVSDLLGMPFFTDAKIGDNFGDMEEWAL